MIWKYALGDKISNLCVNDIDRKMDIIENVKIWYECCIVVEVKVN